MRPRRFLCVFLLSGLLCPSGVFQLHAQSSGPASVPFPGCGSFRSVPSLRIRIRRKSRLFPGRLRSFMRMAAISQKVSPEEVLPLLARNVVANGYQDKRPTEYLILVNWYLDQARELQALAGTGGEIRVSNCEEAQPLLAIFGYRLRQPCGPDAAVETANANRAFLTIDSGFPLADLEETLRGGKPFVLPYFPTKVPVLFKPGDWLLTEKDAKRGVLDSILRDPVMARLYWALSNMDSETSHLLWKSIGPKKLIVSAPVLDFFGSQISVRGGRVLVPGGAAAEPAWRELVGANPRSPAEFVGKMLVKDDGWLTAYFDALSRADATQQAYFTESGRLKRFYEAFRGQDISPNPTRHSFRPDQGLFLLVSRLAAGSHRPAACARECGSVERRDAAQIRFQAPARMGQASRRVEQSRTGDRRHVRSFQVVSVRGAAASVPVADRDRPRTRSRSALERRDRSFAGR